MLASLAFPVPYVYVRPQAYKLTFLLYGLICD